MLDIATVLFLVVAAFVAGFVDAAVGGGGLIQLPALLVGLPHAAITTILGTNKVVACAGTTMAVGQYWKARVLGWREFVGPIVASMIGAAIGVWLAYLLEGRCQADLRPVMLVMLVAMLAFSLLRPELGRDHAPRLAPRRERGVAMVIALALGLYDGFFGPGTGTILIFLFVTVLGFDFVRASALAKGVNWASNVASLVVFVSQGSYVLALALAMAVGNGLGGYMGARTALARGARWVRVLFILVVSALILRLAWQVVHG